MVYTLLMFLNFLLIICYRLQSHLCDQANCKNKNYHNWTVLRNEIFSLSSVSVPSPFRDYLPQRSVKFSNSCCWESPLPFPILFRLHLLRELEQISFLLAEVVETLKRQLSDVCEFRRKFRRKLKSRISYACARNEARLE